MDITEVLDELGIDYVQEGEHHHARSGWVNFDCPYCGRGSHKWHMGYNPQHGSLNCWRCGPHSLIDTLCEITGEKVRTVLPLVKGMDFKRTKREDRKSGAYKPPKGVSRLLHPHKQYLRRRGYDPDELVRLWDLQSIGLQARLAWRLFVPILFHGEEVSWTTRAISDEVERRWIKAAPDEESTPSSHLLYGWDYVRTSAIIVEGPSDVWRIGPGAVATMSVQFTQPQIDLLSTIPRRVICFDSEPAAQRRARQLHDALSIFSGDTWIAELDADDPGSASHKEVEQLRSLL